MRDGEIIGVDTDGCLICWDATNEAPYNCGETIEQYGPENLSARERDRLGLEEI